MTKLVAAILVLATGCGTIFNKNVRYHTEPGVSIEGVSEQDHVNQKVPHVVKYADGSTCTLEPGVAWYYVVVNLATGPIGFIVDGITGGWKVLKGCDGVERLPPGD